MFSTFLIIIGVLVICNFALLKYSCNDASESKTPGEE